MKPDDRRILTQSCGVELSTHQEAQVERYLALLLDWNQRMNLTSVREPAELLHFHFFEALWAAECFMKPRTRLADIGSGAGFPGLVAKIYHPDLQVTLIERVGKKANFLSLAALELGLDVEIFPGTSEDFKAWPSIDLATCRAVALSKRILAPLKRHRVRLLHFHGEHSVPPGPGWNPIERKLYPLSQARWATLYSSRRQS